MGLKTTILLVILSLIVSINSQQCLNDRHRPQIHFSPAANWMNDPNGMVYYNGIYHLFYQYNPNGTINGVMHWGHATSPDMVQWNETDIALYPDELGMIFSGSAVVDSNNVSGLATSSEISPIVAMYTSALERPPLPGTFQQQSIAISNDNGVTFLKYPGNPVIPNLDNTTDIRDPKIIKYGDHWVMVLAVIDRMVFYESYNLINWTVTSEFGGNLPVGSHRGVWECPDLLRFEYNGQEIWVLIVSIDPNGVGGPNGGSGTQYFLGEFDGRNFLAYPQETYQWLDYGPDNYAGVTFASERLNRHVNMAWMSNWHYANKTPTEAWRGQMTLPRVLSLGFIDGRVKLVSEPAPEVEQLRNLTQHYEGGAVEIRPGTVYELWPAVQFRNPLLEVDLKFNLSSLAVNDSFSVCFYTIRTEEVCVIYEAYLNQVVLDRGNSGNTSFSNLFNAKSYADRMTTSKTLQLKIFLDVSAIEIFIDNGFTTMTGIFFPTTPFQLARVNLNSNEAVSRLRLEEFSIYGLNSMCDYEPSLPPIDNGNSSAVGVNYFSISTFLTIILALILQ